jgi:hypothetical protein
LARSLIPDQTINQYTVSHQKLGLTTSWSCFYKTQTNFIFAGKDNPTAGNIGGDYCGSQNGWAGYNQLHDLFFQSDDTSLKNTYIFTGMERSGLTIDQWNLAYGADSNLVWNRGLGLPTSGGSLSYTNQAGHPSVATNLDLSSFLLGLQTINSSKNRDSNTYRPQLQTSYRQLNDNLSRVNSTGHFIPDDSAINDINGARARTG